MYRRSIAYLAALSALPLLGGCVQATRHSNTMVFGTNTSFGIKVGTDTAQVPSIVVGYNRQEAVVMPLVANTVEFPSSTSATNRLSPCNLAAPVGVSGAKFAVHPCLLAAVNGKAMDSYSVLASFGASYDASGSGAKGGLAQYFATGVAAQLLAATGGAAVVSTGDAATASALKAPPVEQTIEALYGDSAEFAAGRALVTPFNDFVSRLLAKIELTPTAGLSAAVDKFEIAANSPIRIANSCTDKGLCKSAVRNAYAIGYQGNPASFEAALTSWAVQ
jgi:hypothetical protein